MDNKLNATCDICGKKYHLCIRCEKNRNSWVSWRRFVDNENCNQIRSILYGYSAKRYSKSKAAKLLKNTDLSELEAFNPEVKDVIHEILGKATVNVTEEKPVVASVKEDIKKEETTTDEPTL